MNMRLIGTTGIQVSQIGLGTVKFGRNVGVRYPSNFALPSDKEITALLESAKSYGINLLDTAPAYGTSEERLGKALLGQRDQWILATKVGEEFSDGKSSFDFSAPHILRSVERSLRRLQTDYVDIVLVHSHGDDKAIIEQDDVFTTLLTLKEKGLIRAYGMSTKTVEGGILTLQQADIAMVTYNPIYSEELPVIEYAAANNKAIFIKKALASGHLDSLGENPVKTAMQYIFQQKGVTSVILGTLNHRHLQEVVSAVELD